MKFLRYLLVVIWMAAVVTTVWGVLEEGAVSRERRAVARKIVLAKTAGLPDSDLLLQEAELTDRRFQARTLALAGVALALGIPVGWGVHKYIASRREDGKNGGTAG